MAHREYLAGLDRSDLLHLVDQAKERIAAIDEEAKKVIWCVEDRDLVHAYFAEADYVKAAQVLLEIAQDIANKPGYKPMDKSLHIKPIFVPESEYSSYLEN